MSENEQNWGIVTRDKKIFVFLSFSSAKKKQFFIFSFRVRNLDEEIMSRVNDSICNERDDRKNLLTEKKPEKNVREAKKFLRSTLFFEAERKSEETFLFRRSS